MCSADNEALRLTLETWPQVLTVKSIIYIIKNKYDSVKQVFYNYAAWNVKDLLFTLRVLTSLRTWDLIWSDYN